MRVLVTGATGFTGGHLARWLAARGDEVRALVRDPSKARELEAAGVKLVKGDLRDLRERGSASATSGAAAVANTSANAIADTRAGAIADTSAGGGLRAALEGVEVVYNIAALYRTAGLPDQEYRVVNADAVGWLIEAAAAAGVQRVVHCSTVGVHGDIERPPANEDAPLRPGDVYQETKLEGERLAREASARTGVGVVIARPTGIYGPGDRRLLKLFRGVARRRFVILGSGEIFYHLTYIDDLAEGFRLCGTHPAAAGRTYILSGPEVTTLKDLVQVTAEVAGVTPLPIRLPVWPFWVAGAVCEAICAPLGIEPPLYRRRVDFFTKSRAFDSTRARQEIGYAPGIGLREGIGRTLAWYREQGWL